MEKLKAYQALIEKQIRQINWPNSPENLYQPLEYFLQIGGKRTRPSLTLLACDLFGDLGIKALDAALSVELFHNFTLIHDDIMDEAPLRRGKETIHTKWDRDIAILAGDVLYAASFDYLLKYPPTIAVQLISVMTQTAKEVCEGQQMDMDFEESSSVDLTTYLEMIRLKTSVLLGASLKMGAIIAGVENQEDIAHIYAFGVHIGMAFQIQDDILDLYADPEKFGKQVGGDLLVNKKTYLLLKAMEVADEETKTLLQDYLGNEKGATKIQKISAVFDQLQIRTLAEETKQYYYQKALEAMNKIEVNPAQKITLLSLAETLMKREY